MSTERNGFRLEDAHHNENELTIEDKQDLEDARAAIEEAEEKGTTSWEEIKKELNIKTVPALLREEAENWARIHAGDVYYKTDTGDGILIEEDREPFLTDAYIAGYEAAEKSIRAELAADPLKGKATNLSRKNKAPKRKVAKKLSPVRKTVKQTNKASSRTNKRTNSRKTK